MHYQRWKKSGDPLVQFSRPVVTPPFPWRVEWSTITAEQAAWLLRGIFGEDYEGRPGRNVNGLIGALGQISNREQWVLYERARGCTLADVASRIPRYDLSGVGVTVERLREMQMKALRLLRHPSRWPTSPAS